MLLTHRQKTALSIGLLVALPMGLIFYKLQRLGYSLRDVLPVTQYEVTYAMDFDGQGGEVKIRTFLPGSDGHQTISEERDISGGLHLSQVREGANRVAIWNASQVQNGASVRHTFKVIPRKVEYLVPSDLKVAANYPASAAALLRPEKEIQVDSPEITQTLRKIGAAEGTVLDRLRRIYDFTSGFPQRPFKGTTDALTALRLGEASCNGKSRLFVALARATGIPARLVGGLILTTGSKRTSHQWVEAYVGGHWVPFCPTNHHFAELPERYLQLYVGDESLFRHVSNINFQYRFETHASLVPSPKAKASFRFFDVWGLFDRLKLPFSLLRTILMLPIGALVVVLFRNVIGLPTFGTFLPALLAAAAAQTGPLFGVATVLLVVLVVALIRWGLQALELLRSPTLAILLAGVTFTLILITMAGEHLGIRLIGGATMFPLAVLAISAERFYMALTEHGPRPALKELAGTIVVMLACFAVMGSLALQLVVVGFPEVLFFVVAANIYLGRWVGMRLSEYLRFGALLRGGAP